LDEKIGGKIEKRQFIERIKSSSLREMEETRNGKSSHRDRNDGRVSTHSNLLMYENSIAEGKDIGEKAMWRMEAYRQALKEDRIRYPISDEEDRRQYDIAVREMQESRKQSERYERWEGMIGGKSTEELVQSLAHCIAVEFFGREDCPYNKLSSRLKKILNSIALVCSLPYHNHLGLKCLLPQIPADAVLAKWGEPGFLFEIAKDIRQVMHQSGIVAENGGEDDKKNLVELIREIQEYAAPAVENPKIEDFALVGKPIQDGGLVIYISGARVQMLNSKPMYDGNSQRREGRLSHNLMSQAGLNGFTKPIDEYTTIATEQLTAGLHAAITAEIIRQDAVGLTQDMTLKLMKAVENGDFEVSLTDHVISSPSEIDVMKVSLSMSFRRNDPVVAENELVQASPPATAPRAPEPKPAIVSEIPASIAVETVAPAMAPPISSPVVSPSTPPPTAPAPQAIQTLPAPIPATAPALHVSPQPAPTPQAVQPPPPVIPKVVQPFTDDQFNRGVDALDGVNGATRSVKGGMDIVVAAAQSGNEKARKFMQNILSMGGNAGPVKCVVVFPGTEGFLKTLQTDFNFEAFLDGAQIGKGSALQGLYCVASCQMGTHTIKIQPVLKGLSKFLAGMADSADSEISVTFREEANYYLCLERKSASYTYTLAKIETLAF
jgi:hypothetical protein